MTLVTNSRQTTLTGGYVGGDWKSALVQVGISVAETVITNYIKDLSREAQVQASNYGKDSRKTQFYPRSKYRSRRRKRLYSSNFL